MTQLNGNLNEETLKTQVNLTRYLDTLTINRFNVDLVETIVKQSKNLILFTQYSISNFNFTILNCRDKRISLLKYFQEELQFEADIDLDEISLREDHANKDLAQKLADSKSSLLSLFNQIATYKYIERSI
jgi:hypothetical protein